GNKARHRGEIRRTNHNRAGIAFWRFYFFHSLEGKLHVVTQPAVENFVRPLTGFRHEKIAGARHAHDRAGDRIEDTTLGSFGDRHSRRVVVGRWVYVVLFQVAVADGDADRVQSFAAAVDGGRVDRGQGSPAIQGAAHSSVTLAASKCTQQPRRL